jgi:hypothetical protein
MPEIPIEKLTALCSQKDHYTLMDWLYKLLNVLDAKADGLLRFDAMLLTAITIVLSGLTNKGSLLRFDPNIWCHLAAVIAMAALGLSGSLCFFIVQLKWGIMDEAIEEPDEAIEETGEVIEKTAKFDFSKDVKVLAGVIERRSRCYFFAWILSFAALIAAVIALYPIASFVLSLQYGLLNLD